LIDAYEHPYEEKYLKTAQKLSNEAKIFKKTNGI